MKHMIGGLAAVVLLSAVAAAPAPAERLVTARAAILVDQHSGEVLWERNADLPLPPASTTKVLTAIVALESGRLYEPLYVSHQAASTPPTKIHLRPGWRVELRDLVYAIMLNSANDASVVIAEGLAGSVPAFARTMNSQARSIGARNTHFVNPNGLPAENHYASARDLATIFGYAMQNREFANIVATKSTMIQPLEGSRRSIALRNHNRLLHDYHIHVVGKTGWTRASKRCFVGAGYADGRELLVAVLGSNDLWADLRALLEFGFEGGVPPIPENAPASITASRSESAPSPKRAKKVAASKQPAPKYAVRLATFQSIDRAKRLRATMTRKGYPARIITVRQDRRTWYRVSVGNYKTRQEAQRAATRMQRIDPSLRTIIVALG